MPKHNIDTIVSVVLAADSAFCGATGEPTPELRDAVRVRVLEAIHGEPKKDQAGGTPDEQRRDRLFNAIVKALTVRL